MNVALGTYEIPNTLSVTNLTTNALLFLRHIRAAYALTGVFVIFVSCF